jgi:hypothetical protein
MSATTKLENSLLRLSEHHTLQYKESASISDAVETLHTQAAKIEALQAEVEALRKDAEWIPVSERLPEIPTNCTREFIVACKRVHNGETYVFAAEYLQDMLLQSTYPDDDDDDEPEDGKPYTGWYQERNCESGDFDTEWQNIEADGSVITHWMPLPQPPIAGEAT